MVYEPRPRHEQVIARPRAGDVQQVPLPFVDILEVCDVADGFEPRLKRDDLVVAGGDHNGAELEALRKGAARPLE